MPAALEQVLISAGFVTLAIVVARLGTVMLAAHQITFVALSFSFLPEIGFGIATTTLVRQSLGARRMDEGATATHIAMRWAVGWMSAIGVWEPSFSKVRSLPLKGNKRRDLRRPKNP